MTDMVWRYHVPLLRSTMERRPATMVPEDGTLAFTDCGTFERADRYIPAIYRDGTWHRTTGQPLKVQPNYWTVALDGPILK